ncbi:hypothetical protein, partial [Microvirga sp. G4-2]|uniref:hypothetical protein n=1 Tax=Microvirga sp. G4-2 TaxID=3434467 RepID=UPI004043A359
KADLRLQSVERLEADIQKGRRAPLASPSSKSCNVVDPLAEQIGSFQAAGEIVTLVDEPLVLVLQQPTRKVRL